LTSAIRLIPSARRLVESLRDIGYDLPSAIADLIDNSIAAQATEVGVDLAFHGEDSWVRIWDNGTGMPVQVLNEAMRYGTRREYSDRDLGKFGLGLKTASMSQCRRLTVATRSDPNRKAVEIRQWDLGYIEERDDWEVLRISPADARPELLEPLRGHPGTVVLWEQLDRVLKYKLPSGLWALDGFARLCRETEDHLAMVFHRFMSSEAKRTLPLKIFVNGNQISPWDPFARSEAHTQKNLPKQTLKLVSDGETHSVTVQPYILPTEVQFSSSLAHKRAEGPRKWNYQQGFYIYRNDRMIQSGGWNRLRAPDEHTKLARIALSFNPDADAAFSLNVSKMQVKLPDQLRSELTALASTYARMADAAYRQKSGSPGSGASAVRESSRPASNADAGTKRDPLLDLIRAILRPVKQIVKRELAAEPILMERILTAISRLEEDLFAEFSEVRPDAPITAQGGGS
jgi:histidine kinase/DNA gyrase B/HSP90-like ATPase